MGLFNKVQEMRKSAGMANENTVSGDTSMQWKRDRDAATKPKVPFGKRFVNFFKETYFELKKVNWPKRADVIRGTALVLAVSLVFGAFFGGIDYLLTQGLELLLKVTAGQ